MYVNSSSLSTGRITGRLAGQDRFVILVQRVTPNTVVPQIVGFRMCQRGTFQAAGMQTRLSFETLFVHQNEVLPKHRGQRVTQLLGDGTLAHCRRRGIRKVCGAIRSENVPSLRAHMRDTGNRIVGTIERVEAIGGLYRRLAPASVVQQMIEGPTWQPENGSLVAESSSLDGRSARSRNGRDTEAGAAEVSRCEAH